MSKIVLSNTTFNRFDKAASDVNSLLNVDKGGKGAQPFKGAKVQRLARLTGETTIANGGLTWKAEEVYLDSAGAVVVKPNGVEWDDDNPIFTLNVATQNAVMMVSQSGRPAVDPDPAKRYWFGNPGGGGGGATLFALITAVTDQQNYTGSIYEAPTASATPIATGVIVKAENINYGQLTISNNFHAGAYVGLNFHISPPAWG